MKIIFKLLLVNVLLVQTVSSQGNFKYLKTSLNEIEKGEFKGVIINDSLISFFLDEYLYQASIQGMNLKEKLSTIDWILIEPESNTPSEFNDLQLGKIDKERKMILLSRLCYLDRNILQATLFRELHHYFGVPYIPYGHGIMALIKPKRYSYGWLSDPYITEIEYQDFFEQLRIYID